MAKKKRNNKFKKILKKYFSLVLVFSLLFFVGSSFYIRFSPYFTVPVIDSREDITTLPPEFKNVLGSKTSPEISARTIKIPILMYHYIEYPDKNDKMRVALNIYPEVLDRQIKSLKDAGYTFLSMSDVDKVFAGKMEVPKKGVVLTFDDGYRDFYEYAYPILKKYNVKAVQYVIANFLDRPNHLYTSQLQEIARDGLVEIGAHTMDHMWLKGVDSKTANYEITGSRQRLQQLTGFPITSFAYPYGAFDQQAIDAVERAGFSDAATTVPGNLIVKENKYSLFRLRPGYRTGKSLVDYISQDFSQ